MSSSIIVKLISDNSRYSDLELQSKDSKPLIIGCNEQSIHIENNQVYIKQLGTNTSFINKIAIKNKQVLNDGDILHLLENDHSYTIRIEFIKPMLKRQNTDDDDDDQISFKKQKGSKDNIE